MGLPLPTGEWEGILVVTKCHLLSGLPQKPAPLDECLSSGKLSPTVSILGLALMDTTFPQTLQGLFIVLISPGKIPNANKMALCPLSMVDMLSKSH